MGLYTQYPKPRCWHCKQFRDPRLKGLGFDLREVRRTEKAVLVQCQTCHHRWWSHNQAALGGVLTVLPW